jgi:aminoglycoside 6-adenylyltransferase
LLDKDGLTAGLPAPTYRAYIPQPPSEAVYQALVQEFWWETTYVARNLWCDELYFAKYSLDTGIRFECLQRVLEWYVESQHGWSIRPGVCGKGLKRLLDAETWAEVERTYAGAGIEENWEALFATIRLFRRMAMSVAESLGFQYPTDTDAAVSAYLEKVRRLPPDATDLA